MCTHVSTHIGTQLYGSICFLKICCILYFVYCFVKALSQIFYFQDQIFFFYNTVPKSNCTLWILLFEWLKGFLSLACSLSVEKCSLSFIFQMYLLITLGVCLWIIGRHYSKRKLNTAKCSQKKNVGNFSNFISLFYLNLNIRIYNAKYVV